MENCCCCCAWWLSGIERRSRKPLASKGGEGVGWELGAYPKGEGVRMEDCLPRGRNRCDLLWPSTLGDVSGDKDELRSLGPSLGDEKDVSSGLAMRSPPKDWDRLRSFSIAESQAWIGPEALEES